MPASSSSGFTLQLKSNRPLVWKLNTVHHGMLTSVLPVQTTIEIADDIEVLKSSEQVLIQRTVQADLANTFEEPYEPPQIAGSPEQNSSEEPSQAQLETSLLTRLLENDLNEERAKAAALYLCEALNWEECVTTVISLEKRKFALNHRPELRLAGFLKSPFEVVIHVDRFRRRLTDEIWHNLLDAMKEQVKMRLEGGV